MLSEIAALWKNERGNLTGKLGNTRIIVLPNKDKKEDKHPDYRIFVAIDDKKQEGNDPETGLPF